MSNEEIIEGNKLIAEFMGWEKHNRFGDKYLMNKNKDRKLPPFWTKITNAGALSDFNYNYSWDWLMPVVEKIEKELFWQIELYRNQCKIWHETDGKTLWRETESKIQSTWLAVVEFIKWYNQNKQQ